MFSSRYSLKHMFGYGNQYGYSHSLANNTHCCYTHCCKFNSQEDKHIVVNRLPTGEAGL